MSVGRALLVATAAECGFVGGLLAFLSLGGFANGWLDILAQFAPIWGGLSFIGWAFAVLARRTGSSVNSIIGLSLLGLAAASVLVLPDIVAGGAQQLSALRRPLGGSFDVLTFNVWDLNQDRERTVDLIIRANADVVAIQEVGGIGGSAFDRLKTSGYVYRGGWTSQSDIEIFSKRPLGRVTVQMFDLNAGQPLAPRPLAVVSAWTTMADGTPVHIMTTHYAWPLPPSLQRTEREIISKLIGQSDRRDLILAGDFNLNPWSYAMKAQDQDLSPLIRRTHGIFTWPVFVNFGVVRGRVGIPFLAIDQVYAGPLWKTGTVSRLPRGGSDHYGILVQLIRSQ
jgi:endonuclease/exonuclease/phosphatase (EEP) superfamily protein YafD